MYCAVVVRQITSLFGLINCFGWFVRREGGF